MRRHPGFDAGLGLLARAGFSVAQMGATHGVSIYAGLSSGPVSFRECRLEGDVPALTVRLPGCRETALGTDAARVAY